MTNKKFQISVDMREQRSEVTKRLEKSDVVSVVYSDLAIGDYLLSDDVIVERKEATDFVLSIMDRRLFGQVAHMRAAGYARPIIILEGDIFATRSLISHDAIRGALSWLVVLEGVNLVYSKNAVDTSTYIEVMARHAQEGLGYEIPLRGSKPKDLDVCAQFVIEGLPGCGPTMAKKLLAHFGSARAVIGASVEDLVAIKGVGKKTAEQICLALDHKIS